MTELASATARLDKINYSLLVLIPKKDKPLQVVNFCPICLLNYTVKILSKVLANWLKVILGDLVDD